MKSFSSRCRLFVQGAFRLAGVGAALLAGTAALTIAPPVQAAEEIVFFYGPFSDSIAIEELTSFAETGEASSTLRFYLNTVNVEPEIFRTILTEQLPVRLQFADSALYSLPGEYALFQIGQVVRTESRRANIQALRSAVVLSVSEDNRISLLEFLQNYPTPQLYVEGQELARVARDVGDVVEDVRARLQIVVAAVEEILPGLICDCER